MSAQSKISKAVSELETKYNHRRNDATTKECDRKMWNCGL
jgi:hypothetical protein